MRGGGGVGGQPGALHAGACGRAAEPEGALRATSTAMKLAIEVPVTRQAARRSSGKPNSSARPADDLALDLDRRVVAAAEIGVQPAGQHLGQHADRRAAAMHPAHEAGMQIAGGVGQDESRGSSS